jgi:poly(3-hydroxybutyrate) depolymerase
MQRAGSTSILAAGTLLMNIGVWSSACSSSTGSTSPAVQGQAGVTAPGASHGTAGANSAASGTGASSGTAGTTATGQAGSNLSAQAGGSASGAAGNTTPAGASGAGGAAGNVTMPAAGSGGTAGSGGAAGSAAEEACNVTIPPSMDCAAKLAPGDERTCMLGTRKYIVHAGKTMNPCKPVALVIDAHGATETAPQQLGKEKFCSGSICWAGLGSGWAAESDMPGGGFIAVFPQGNNNMWQASDADFMVMLVDEMKKLADVDPKKVYISGISNGGFLTFQTGCPHSDIFHGMAPNSGGNNCTSLKQPIPLIAFDAMADFAYSSNVNATNTVVKLNNCKGDAKPWITVDSKYEEAVCRTAKGDTMAKIVPCTQVTSAMIKPTTCKIWDECDGGVKVAFCEVAPNTEHGASNASTDAHILYENDTILNTPSLAWRFFKLFW